MYGFWLLSVVGAKTVTQKFDGDYELTTYALGDTPPLPGYVEGVLLDISSGTALTEDHLQQVRDAIGGMPLFLRVPEQPPQSLCEQYDIVAAYPATTPDAWACQLMVQALDGIYHQRINTILGQVMALDIKTTSHESMLLSMLEEIRRWTGCEAVNISVFNDQYVFMKYRIGYPDALVQQVEQFGDVNVTLSAPNLMHILHTGEPVIFPDTHNEPSWVIIEPHDWIRSWVGIPIKRDNVVIGILNLDAAKPNQLQPGHIRRLAPLQAHIAMLLEMTQLYEMLDSYTNLLAFLNRQNALLFAPLSQQNTLQGLCVQVAETVVRTFGKTDCGVMLIDEEQQALVRHGRAGDYHVRASGLIPLDGKGLVAEAIRTGEMVYSPDVTQDTRYIANEPQTRSELVVPLITYGGVIGALDLQSSEVGAFALQDRDGLQAFAHHAATAIQNLRNYIIQRAYTLDMETQVRQRTEEMERAKERVELILNYTSEAVLLLRGQPCTIEQWNHAFELLMGREGADYFNQPLATFVTPGDRPRLQATLDEMHVTGKSYTVELHLSHTENPTRSVEAGVTLTPTAFRPGYPLTIVCTIRNLTQQRKVEQSLRRALENEREMSQLKTHFIKTVHHQFLTPLTTVLSSSELIHMYMDKVIDTAKSNEQTLISIDRHFNTIEQEVRGLEKLLSEIEFMSQATGNTLNFEPNIQDVVSLTEMTIRMMNYSLPEHTISLEVTFEDGEKAPSPEFKVDGRMLQQMLQQMLSNAAKYSPDVKEIDVYLTVTADEVLFEVVDYGIGIPEDDIDQLFRPFFRGKAADQLPGTGLGLTILKHVSDLHRGRVQVQSDDSGTHFRVHLPRYQQERT